MRLLTIKDENLQGVVLSELILKLSGDQISVRELIASRVRAEIDRYHEQVADKLGRDGDKFASLRTTLVKPSDLEARLNDYDNKKSFKSIDADEQIATALKAFESNGFFILVDDEQVERLEEQVLLRDSTTVSFIKLIPLIGG